MQRKSVSRPSSSSPGILARAAKWAQENKRGLRNAAALVVVIAVVYYYIIRRWMLESNIVDQLKSLDAKRHSGEDGLVGQQAYTDELEALQTSIEEYKASYNLDIAKARVLTQRAGAEWDEWESMWTFLISGDLHVSVKCNADGCVNV